MAAALMKKIYKAAPDMDELANRKVATIMASKPQVAVRLESQGSSKE